VVRPGNLAIAAGGMGGQLAAFGNPFAGLGVTVGGPIAYELRDRVRAGLPAVLGMVPGPGLFNTAMAGAAGYQSLLPKPLPIEAYRGEFMQTLTKEKARDLAFGSEGDLQTFIRELAKLSEEGRARDMTAAQKYVAEFIAKRGLTIQSNQEPRTEWDLEEDTGLAPLVAAQKEALADVGSPHRSNYTPFGRSFFWDDMRGGQAESGRYLPREYPPSMRFDTTKARFVVWRIKEIAATPMAWDDTTRAEVRKTWKRLKARELAKARAEALAAGIREHVKSIEAGGPGDASVVLLMYLRDEAEKLRAQAPTDAKSQRRALPFPIRGVCPLTGYTGNPTGETGLPSFGAFDRPLYPGPVQLFQLPPSENIKYPSPDFRAIMDERTKPSGTVLVIPDAAKDTFFVATLVKRDVKTEYDYITQVASGRRSDDLGGQTIAFAARRYASEQAGLSILALLKHEFKYEENEEQKKKLDTDAASGGEN
jgi:hypothetical protein